MRCPKCNWFKVFEDYNRSNPDGEWQREIYCPCCHHKETLPISEDETLEDFSERQLQRIHNSVKMKIVKAFQEGGEYHNGLILQDSNDAIVDVEITIKRYDHYFEKKYK